MKWLWKDTIKNDVCGLWMINRVSYFLKVYIYFIYFAALGLTACGVLILVAACGVFSCGMRDLVPQPRITPGPPAMGAQNLCYWTTREVPKVNY